MLLNKKGYSTGFSWVMAILIIGICGLIILLFNQVFTVHLMPAMYDLSATQLNVTQQADFTLQAGNYLKWLASLPVIVIIIIVVYLVTNTMRRKAYEE